MRDSVDKPRTYGNSPRALEEPLAKRIKDERRWVIWRWIRKDNGKWTKEPYVATNPDRLASSDKPATWRNFDQACSAVEKGEADGIGFNLLGSKISAFDIDDCRDPETGELHPFALDLIERANSYTEITPSGTGLRIIGIGSDRKLHRKLKGSNSALSVEFFRNCERFITISNLPFDGVTTELNDIDALLDTVLAELEQRKKSASTGPDNKDHADNEDDAPLPNSLASLLHIKGSGAYQSRSELLFAFITGAMKAGVTKAVIIKACIDATYAGAGIFEHVKENGGAAYVERQIEHAQQKGVKSRTEQLTELGNARQLVKRYGEDLRFVHPWNSWLLWRDQHWRRDEDGAIMRLAKDTVKAMFEEAVGVNDEAKRNTMLKHALQSQKANQLRNMVMLAESEAEVILSPNKWDADPLTLGVQNGIIDLRSGNFRKAVREDYITKLAGTSYDQHATCPNWESFLLKIFDNDRELVTYVQRACGYTLTGLTVEEVLFVLWGLGANGKSTLRETLFCSLGDYAMGSDANLLITRKQNAATPDLARLFGRRLVTINETEDKDHLNESRVKFITSHDIITARNLYQAPFDFIPTHKTMLTTNHKPIVRGTDDGIWRRIHLWPFTVKIQQPDRNFRETNLLPELPGILNWMLYGLKQYQLIGLKPPRRVLQATEEYREEMDLIGMWIDECCELGEKYQAASWELYNDYDCWAECEIGFKLTAISFGRDLAARGFKKAKVNGKRGFAGLRLHPPPKS
jgi:putative DNA primase/helicase